MLFNMAFRTYSQNDVTRFLDIPIDGFKSDMIQKLKSKGYSLIPNSDGILEGEFNGMNVEINVQTNNNKVWRIIVAEKYANNETNIKIKFNNLIRQFADNQRYFKLTDSIIAKYTIPEDEDISYEISIKKKRYDANFYQNTSKYDSLSKEKDLLLAKENLNDEEKEKLFKLMSESIIESKNCINKTVWFMISKDYNDYRIAIFYENKYNKANGEGL